MAMVKPIGKQSAGTGGLSNSLGAARGLLRGQLWIRPIIAALILGVLGWYMNGVIEGALHKQLGNQLQTILDADVESLRIWIREQEIDAELMVAAAPLLPAVAELTEIQHGPQGGLLQSKRQAELRAYLQPRLKHYGYSGYFLVSPALRVIAANDDAAIGKQLDGARADFYRNVLGGRSAVTRPYRSPLLLPDERGELKTGLPTIFTAAPVRDSEGRPVAALGLRIPEHEFSKILQIARAGETGDTFAFDKNGLFLSHSRFDDALRRVGLLADLPDVRSMLTLEVRDPQVNMMAGERPTVTRAEQPLTRMAAAAVTGTSGVDVAGYRDYRGVPVIGAWTWLPEFDFGVATEIDVAEAYRPLFILRTTFWVLFGLLILGAVAIFAFTIVLARQRHRMEKAERKISQLGQYTLEEKIGAGGMGSVYRASHAFLRRPTAIKMLNADMANEGILKRFEREVQLTSQLNHPNTIAVYDYGRTPDGVFYYAMEYLDGISLEDLVTLEGPLPERRVINILQQVCGSLAEAHAIGLIHRDIKPANVIVTRRAGIADFVKVLDFGLVKVIDAGEEAKLTQANVTVGTPYYISPEAVERPETITAAADIYAIGAVGYFLLTGSPVFAGSTVMEICMKHVRAVPEAPSKRRGHPLSAGIEGVILRCLAKAPRDRPPSAQALMEELAQCEAAPGWTHADAEAWWSDFKRPGGTQPVKLDTDMLLTTPDLSRHPPSAGD
jgi:eukaryotic-like serine/threonine-protein kinase